MGVKIFGAIFLVVALAAGLYIFQSGSYSGIGKALKGAFTFSTSTPRAVTTSSRPVVNTEPGRRATTTRPGTTPTRPPVSQPTSTIALRDIPEGYTVDDLSPLFRTVRLSIGSRGAGTAYSQMTVRASSLPAGEVVNVTGWQIKARNGGVFIPQAINVYDPLGIAPDTDIVMMRGNVVHLYSNTNPTGRNYRLNACIGYLADTLKMNPSFPTSCPRIDRNDIDHLTGLCQNYILSIGSCKEPRENPPISIYDYSCREFLRDINYRGCFIAHRADSDFLKGEWRVWTGSKFLDVYHDKVFLLDRAGKIVDYVFY